MYFPFWSGPCREWARQDGCFFQGHFQLVLVVLALEFHDQKGRLSLGIFECRDKIRGAIGTARQGNGSCILPFAERHCHFGWGEQMPMTGSGAARVANLAP